MRVCSIEGCTSKHFCKGMCRSHYTKYTYRLKHPIKPERLCNVEGCDEKHHRSGYCKIHFSRLIGKHKTTKEEAQKRKCTVEGCTRKHYAKGLCSKHYQKMKKGKRKEKEKRSCSVEGCKGKHSARGLCKKHYDSFMRNDESRKEKVNGYRNKFRNTEKGKEQRRRLKEKRRARQRNVPVIGDFTNKEIFVRDSYVCSICGLLIDPSLKFPNRLSASLEHSVPISKGGPHSEENVTCSHLTCNVKRGNRELKYSFEGAGI